MLLLSFQLNYFFHFKNFKKGLSRVKGDRYYTMHLKLCTLACANNQEYFNSSDTIFILKKCIHTFQMHVLHGQQLVFLERKKLFLKNKYQAQTETLSPTM